MGKLTVRMGHAVIHGCDVGQAQALAQKLAARDGENSSDGEQLRLSCSGSGCSDTEGPVRHQAALIVSIRDAAVGTLNAVQKLGLQGQATNSLPTAMRAAPVRTLFSGSATDQKALSTLDFIADADSAFRHLTSAKIASLPGGETVRRERGGGHT